MSSVPSENHRHQDVLPQRGLPWDPGTVLWAVPEEPIWRGCQEGAARSGQAANKQKLIQLFRFQTKTDNSDPQNHS